jgi:hypothetical protein
MLKLNNKGLTIKTHNGYKKFDGIQKLHKKCIEISTTNIKLSCSETHLICVDVDNMLFENANKLSLDDHIYTVNGYESVVSITELGMIDVYDILGVEESSSYFTNGILSHNCQFLDTGDASLNEELFDRLKAECCDPKHILKEGKYKIWEEYDPEHIYAIGGDVAEGVGLDASVLEIFDITNPLEIVQVAEYHNNMIGPAEFTNEIVDIASHWGNPLLLIERNNQGSGVCDNLANIHMYQNLVSWGAKVAHKNHQNGMISHINTKHRAVTNQRYFVNETEAVKFRSLECLKEFKTFVRYPNGSWKAKSGEYDDRVMATVWMLMALYNEITELYFEIEELDNCDKPKRIKPIDMDLHKYRTATSIYTNEEVQHIENSNLAPVSFGHGGEGAQADIMDMMAAGWTLPDGSPYADPSRDVSPEQWALFDKYF